VRGVYGLLVVRAVSLYIQIIAFCYDIGSIKASPFMWGANVVVYVKVYRRQPFFFIFSLLPLALELTI
jgi:hypothetical protein